MAPASLMVRLTPGLTNDTLLRFTADLAGRLKATQVIGIAACQPPQLFYGAPDMYVPQEVIDRDRAQIEAELKAAEDRFRTRLEGKVTCLEWRSTVTYGPLVDYIAEQMRAADLLITVPDEGGSLFDATRQIEVADLVLKAGRPVLVVAATVDELDLGSVVVGWKDTREARRAVEDALPLLKLADRVTVAEVTSDEELPEAAPAPRTSPTGSQGTVLLHPHAPRPRRTVMSYSFQASLTRSVPDCWSVAPMGTRVFASGSWVA